MRVISAFTPMKQYPSSFGGKGITSASLYTTPRTIFSIKPMVSTPVLHAQKKRNLFALSGPLLIKSHSFFSSSYFKSSKPKSPTEKRYTRFFTLAWYLQQAQELKSWTVQEYTDIRKHYHRLWRAVVRDRLLRLTDLVGSRFLVQRRLASWLSSITPDDDEMVLQQRFVKYIPITKLHVIDRVSKIVDPHQQAMRVQFADLLSTYIYQSYQGHLMQLKDIYSRMDPDQERFLSLDEMYDTRLFSAGQQEREHQFFTHLEFLMSMANYTEIPQAEIREQLSHRKVHEGLTVSVDLDSYPLLRIWTRGRTVTRRTVRVGFMFKTVDIEEYKQVFLAARVPDQDEKEDIFLKLIRDVPCDGLETLLPNAQPQMSDFDLLLLGSAGVAAAGTFAYRGSIKVTDLSSGLLAVSMCLGLVAYRVYYSYYTKRLRYTAHLVESLHFRSLANNMAALTHLVDMARVERFKGLYLAYWFAVMLQRKDLKLGVEPRDIKKEVEGFVGREFGLAVTFDSELNCQRLVEMGLAEMDESGRLSVDQPVHAIQYLTAMTTHVPEPKANT